MTENKTCGCETEGMIDICTQGKGYVPVATEQRMGVGYVATADEAEKGETDKNLHPDGSAFLTPEVLSSLLMQDMEPVIILDKATTQDWTVPDLKGNGKSWKALIRVKGSGGGGAPSGVSGTSRGGAGGGEGCLVTKIHTFTPGQLHTLHVGKGGQATPISNPIPWGVSSPGEASSVQAVTEAPGALPRSAGGRKARTAGEFIVNGAPGDSGGAGYEATAEADGGIGGGQGGGTSNYLPVDGCGGAGATFQYLGTPQLGQNGADGFIEIYKIY